MNYILNSRSDLDALALSDLAAHAAHAAFIDRLRASLITPTDVAEYPEDYDRATPPSAPGYIEPIIENRATPETAARFGFTPEDLV